MDPTPRLATASQVLEAASFLRRVAPKRPRVGLILGSGLGALADGIADPVIVPYGIIPHFPVSTVEGHRGEFVSGVMEGIQVVALRGRVHLYEGYSPRQVAFPVRVMRRLGADVLIVTNAAGGLNEGWSTGDLMVTADHINLAGMVGQSPLVGEFESELGERFLDMLSAYDPPLREYAHLVARKHGFSLREGVYAMVVGPAYETMAELRFLQKIGADAVGMSTVPEVVVARHEKMRVLALSAITNTAAGSAPATNITHAEVLAAAEYLGPRLEIVVRGVLEYLRS